MRITMMAALVVVLVAGTAAAGTTVMFDFEGTASNPLADGNAGPAVGDYMSELWPPSTVTQDVQVFGGRIENNDPLWPVGTTTNYVRTNNTGDFEIKFNDVLVRSVKFDFAVFDDGSDNDFDFEIMAYGANYTDSGGTAENPNAAALIGSANWSNGNAGEFAGNSGWLAFDSDVTLLVFSDSGHHDVGIDNLVLSTDIVTPLPAAAWLGLLLMGGLTATRRLRRRS